MKETYVLCNNTAERTAVLNKLEEESYVWAITVDDHIYRYSRDEVIKAMDFAKV